MQEDWTPSRVVGEIKIRGGSLRSLSIEARLAPDTLRNALYRHCPKYEEIIARFLGVRKEDIWPSRYKRTNKIKLDRFIRYLKSEDIAYKVTDGKITVFDNVVIPAGYKADFIPDNTTVMGRLDLFGAVTRELPDNLHVKHLDIRMTDIKKIPPTTHVTQTLSLDIHNVQNIEYKAECGEYRRTIFACYINDDFMIRAGCFLGHFKKFTLAVNSKYYYDQDAANRYVDQARECIIKLASRLKKIVPEYVLE